MTACLKHVTKSKSIDFGQQQFWFFRRILAEMDDTITPPTTITTSTTTTTPLINKVLCNVQKQRKVENYRYLSFCRYSLESVKKKKKKEKKKKKARSPGRVLIRMSFGICGMASVLQPKRPSELQAVNLGFPK